MIATLIRCLFWLLALALVAAVVLLAALVIGGALVIRRARDQRSVGSTLT